MYRADCSEILLCTSYVLVVERVNHLAVAAPDGKPVDNGQLVAADGSLVFVAVKPLLAKRERGRRHTEATVSKYIRIYRWNRHFE